MKMRKCILVTPPGYVEYKRAHVFQHKVVKARIEGKIDLDVLIVLEHHPVFTFGRHAKRENILVPPSLLQERGIEVVSVERGGDVTFHGPGQVVAYPLFSLKRPRMGVREFVFLLEEVMIRIGQRMGIELSRRELNRGVWKGDCKIGSVGIAVRRGISYHGIAFNVCVDRTFFSWINPCGLTGIKIGSLIDYAELKAEMITMKEMMVLMFSEIFSLEVVDIYHDLSL